MAVGGLFLAVALLVPDCEHPRSDSRSSRSVAARPPSESRPELVSRPSGSVERARTRALFPLAPGLQVSSEPPDLSSWAQ